MLAPGVVRTPVTDPTIAALDRYFGGAGLSCRVTSILRDPRQQLQVIVNLARSKLGHAPSFGAGDVDTVDSEKAHYVWQQTWSELLARGVVVNPPRRAAVLLKYTSPRGRVVQPGTMVNPTPHSRGDCFDIGAQAAGIDRVAAVVEAGREAGVNIAEITREPQNGCVHVGVFTQKPRQRALGAA